MAFSLTAYTRSDARAAEVKVAIVTYVTMIMLIANRFPTMITVDAKVAVEGMVITLEVAAPEQARLVKVLLPGSDEWFRLGRVYQRLVGSVVK